MINLSVKDGKGISLTNLYIRFVTALSFARNMYSERGGGWVERSTLGVRKMMGFGLGFGGVFLMLMVWFVLVLLAVWLVRALFVQPQPPRPHSSDCELSVAEIVEQRYARGEITRDQYESMRRALSALHLG
jgi:putative membrane protein